MHVQLRLIGKVVFGPVAITGVIIALTLWEPLAGFGLGAVLFYGYMTMVLGMVERQNQRLAR
jgi:hypothetical protein